MKFPDIFRKSGNRTLSAKRPINWNLVYAFLIPFCSMLLVMMAGRYEPFGNDRALLYSDEYHQYYPFFLSFRRALVNGDGLLWNWDVGMGMDFLGLYSYYLASPLNWLCVLFPEGWMLEYFAMLSPIKLGFAGLFFAWFLQGVFHKKDFSSAVFGGFYALCAFALAYQWNIMWLDSFALLPLVMLGMVKLLKDKKFILYTVALFFAFASNYYIGYMVCIFVLLTFFCYEICRFPGFKRFFADFGRMALFSVLALGMTLVLTLPGLTSLLQTNSVDDSLLQTPPSSSSGVITEQTTPTTKNAIEAVLETFGLNICGPYEKNYWEDYHEDYSKAQSAYTAYHDALDNGRFHFKLAYDYYTACIPLYLTAMRRIAGNLGGGQALGFMEGLPNVYCGIGTVLLAFMFLLAKEVKWRDKICSLLLVLFLMVSFIDRRLDFAWHGFHFTNMIPYRFSFLLSFVLLYMAYHAWTLRHRFKLWQIAIAAILTVGILACSDNRTDYAYLAFNLPFFLLTVCILLLNCAERMLPTRAERTNLPAGLIQRHSNLISGALVCVLALELAMNVVNFGTRFPYTGVADYPIGGKDSQQIIAIMKEREDENDFYRTEVARSQTLNDGALNGYHGISTFSSSANSNVTAYLKNLGQAALPEWNRYCYEETSPVSNLFLNLKYLVVRNDYVAENSCFNELYSIGDITLLENNAYLPLGFLAESSMAHANLGTVYEAFDKQNRLFSAATGLPDKVWTPLNEDSLTITSTEATLSSQSSSGYSTFTGSESGGTIHYTYTIEQEGLLCMNMNFSSELFYYAYVNDYNVHGDYVNLPQLTSVAYVRPGDTVELVLYCNANTYYSATITAAVLDEEVFRRGYDILNASTLDITSFESTRIEGTIDCNRSGLLYTSIPYNGNWEVYVDGQKAKITLVENAMTCVMLEEGNHEVTFVYRNKAFTVGLIVSLVCLSVFILLIVLEFRRRRNTPPAAAEESDIPALAVADEEAPTAPAEESAASGEAEPAPEAAERIADLPPLDTADTSGETE